MILSLNVLDRFFGNAKSVPKQDRATLADLLYVVQEAVEEWGADAEIVVALSNGKGYTNLLSVYDMITNDQEI